MTRKRPSGAKRFREQSRRQRQEEKALRRAARRAAKGSPADDGAPETEGEEGDGGPTRGQDVARDRPAADGGSRGRVESDGTRGLRDGAVTVTRAAARIDGAGALLVTRRASELLLKILSRENAAAGFAVRFAVAGDGSLSVSLDRGRPDDKTFAHEGTTVLVMEPALARRLENNTLDIEESSDGVGLMLTSRGVESGSL
jgi:hypothetical protein